MCLVVGVTADGWTMPAYGVTLGSCCPSVRNRIICAREKMLRTVTALCPKLRDYI